MSVLAAGFLIQPLRSTFAQSLTKSDPAQDFQVPYQAKVSTVFSYTRATFEPYVGGVFQTLGADGKTVDLTLVSVRDCTPDANAQKVTKKSRPSECFALNFRASGPLPDLSSIYKLNHGALGQFDLFLTRRGDPDKEIFYEAVINHAQ
jgi:hypothetical protein